MEVLLLQDIPGIGKKNDLLVVGDGFALNNLLPMRKALVATPTVRKRYAEQIRRRAEEKMTEQAAKDGAVAELKGKSVSLKRKATKTGKLYAAITQDAIAEALRDEHKITVSEEDITIEEQIKALGEFTVQVKLGDASADLKVEVAQEK